MESYRTPAELQYWIDSTPAALIPTWGVRVEPPAGQSSCRCHRCKPGDTSAGKHPRRKWRDLENGLKPAVLGLYLQRFHDDPSSVGWALATGRAGLAVLDVDPRNGGTETLARLLGTHGDLPTTPQDETGGGGYHWYFRWQKQHLGRSAITLGPGVELLAGNHLIQIAPSVHYTGHEYRWLSAPWDVPFAAPPAWLADQLTAAVAPSVTPQEIRYAEFMRRVNGDRRIDRARAYLARTPVAVAGQGGWQHTNAVVTRVTRGFALSLEEACDVIGEWNLGCSPPWSDSQIRSKCKWALDQPGETGFLLSDRQRGDEDRKIKVRARVGHNRIAKHLAEVDQAAAEPVPATPKIVNGIDVELQARMWDKYYAAGYDVAESGPDGTPTCSELERRRRNEQATNPDIVGTAAAEIEKIRHEFAPCPRARTIVTERTDQKTDEKVFCLIQPRCEAWSCPACGHLHRGEWAINYRCRIAGVAGESVWAIEAPRDQQTTIVARIRRQRGEYFFVDTPEPNIRLIVANVPFAGATETPKDEAVAMLIRCINLFDGHRKPGGSSRGWSLPKRDKSKHDYKLLAVVSDGFDDEATEERLAREKVAIEPVEIPNSHRWRIVRYRQIRLGHRSKAARERVLKRLLDLPLGKIRFGIHRRPEPGEFDDDCRPETSVFDQPCITHSVPGWSNSELEHAF